jgi:cobalt-zinc-cadmium efflux system outer membrane protein
MAKKRLLALSVASFLLTAAYAQQDAALNADQAVQIAVTRNRDFLALRERIRETEALLRQASVRPFPTIEVDTATGRPLGTVGEEEYSAGYSQPIETGGKRQKRTSVARLAVELSAAELLEKQRQLTFDVRSRYAEAVAAQRKLEAVRALVQIDRENYDLTTARVRAGDAAPLEAALFMTEANKTQAQQIAYGGRLASSLSELRRVLGLTSPEPFGIRFEFSPSLSLPTIEDLQRRASDRPDLRALRITERQIGAEVDLARAEGKPDLTASARYSLRNSKFDQFGLSSSGSIVPIRDRDNILTLGISIPVFTGNRNRGNIEAAEARGAGARQRRGFLEGAIPLEVEYAYRRLETARQGIQLLSEVIGQSENNLKVIREAYRLGQLRALDVLNEQRRLVDTRLSFIDTQLEEEQARIELERATGGSIR